MRLEDMPDEQLLSMAQDGDAAKALLADRDAMAHKRQKAERDAARLQAVALAMDSTPAEAEAMEHAYQGTLHLLDGHPVVLRHVGGEQGSPYPAHTEIVDVFNRRAGLVSHLATPIGAAADFGRRQP